MNEQWQGVMQKHAKSFHLASLFFPKHLLPKVKALYALCRWVDDAADEAPTREEAYQALSIIEDDLHAEESSLPVNQIYKHNNLDAGYIDDLIDGAKSDLKEVRIENEFELRQYCYKVAGTVGLAMSDLMDVKDQKARAFAVDLGIAMQITNICRDVKEDAKNNRVYIPKSILEKHDIKVQSLLRLEVKDEAISLATKDMLKIADNYYFSAQKAYFTIPWRTRGAIIIASKLYRSIGTKLLKQGANPLKGRTYLTATEKVGVLSQGIASWATSSLKKNKLLHDSRLHRGLESWKEKRGFST